MSTECVPEGSFLAEKQQRLVDDHKPPSSNEAKNKYRFSSVPPIRLHNEMLNFYLENTYKLSQKWTYIYERDHNLLSDKNRSMLFSEYLGLYTGYCFIWQPLVATSSRLVYRMKVAYSSDNLQVWFSNCRKWQTMNVRKKKRRALYIDNTSNAPLTNHSVTKKKKNVETDNDRLLLL